MVPYSPEASRIPGSFKGTLKPSKWRRLPAREKGGRANYSVLKIAPIRALIVYDSFRRA
jgi:hypothetical protein